MINGIHTLNVLTEVAGERAAQDERWGQQDHPVHTPEDPDGSLLLNWPYAQFEQRIKMAFQQGARSWAVIELEEIFEALAARTPKAQRQEWVQVAAVAVAAVEAMDRAEAKRHGPGCELELYHGGDCGPSAVHQALSERSQDRIPDTFKAGVPLADMVSRVAPDIQLTADQKWMLAALPDATVELKLESIPVTGDPQEGLHRHGVRTDPYDAVGGDLEALERARGALGRAPVCGLEAAAARPCPDHGPAIDAVPEPLVDTRLHGPSIRHPWGGEGRLHGICRCGEGPDDPIHRPDPHSFMATYSGTESGDLCHCFQGKDAATHRCPACDHPFHPAEQPCTAGECDCGE
jgi:hypothetical protein